MNERDLENFFPLAIFDKSLSLVEFNHEFKILFKDPKIGCTLEDLSAYFQKNGLSSDFEIDILKETLEVSNEASLHWLWKTKLSNNYQTMVKIKKVEKGYLVLVVDTHKLHEEIDELKRDNQFLNNSLDFFSNIFFITQHDGTIVHANTSFYEFFSIEKTLESKYNIKNIYNPKRTIVSRNQHSFESEDQVEDTFFKTYCYSLLNQDGEGYANCHFLIDITAEKKLAHQLKDEQAKSIEQSKLATLGEMAGGIAHEINNPLTIIQGSSKLLRKRLEKGTLTPEQINKALDDIESTVQRINKIITGLRNISRDSTHEKLEIFSLKEIFDDILGLCAEKFKSRGVPIEIVGLEENPDLKFHCLRVQLSQVFLNLLNNAFDAVHEDESPWIKIKISHDDDKVVFKIIDSGEGIPKKVQQKLFLPFFTTKEIGKGTGLGLSLSHNILAQHNGSITYNSNSPNTCFEVSIPKKQSSSIAKAS